MLYISLFSVALTLIPHVFASEETLGAKSVASDDDGFFDPSLWYPKVGQAFQIVLSATIDGNRSAGPLMPESTQILDLDLFDNTAEDIARLKAAGKKVICYFSAGTSETWRPDYREFREQDQAAPLPQWPGERWLDIRTWDVLRIMRARIRLAAWKGCDAIDPDNMDGYSNENGGGFRPPLTQKDSIRYVKELARYARSWGMTMGLKNAQEIIPFVIKELAFAVNEQCGEDDGGCEDYRQMLIPVKGRKMPVYHIEYVTDPIWVHGNGTVVAMNATGHWNGTAGITPKEGRWTFGHVQEWGKGMSAEEIRAKLCLDKYPDLQSHMSTVIKVLKLDGWVLYCSGHAWNTRGTLIKNNPINKPGATKGKKAGGESSAAAGSESSAAGNATASSSPETIATSKTESAAATGVTSSASSMTTETAESASTTRSSEKEEPETSSSAAASSAISPTGSTSAAAAVAAASALVTGASGNAAATSGLSSAITTVAAEPSLSTISALDRRVPTLQISPAAVTSISTSLTTAIVLPLARARNIDNRLDRDLEQYAKILAEPDHFNATRAANLDMEIQQQTRGYRFRDVRRNRKTSAYWMRYHDGQVLPDGPRPPPGPFQQMNLDARARRPNYRPDLQQSGDRGVKRWKDDTEPKWIWWSR